MKQVAPNHYIGEVVEDEEGELVIELPLDMLNQMGWDEHTLLEWLIEEDKVILKEKEVEDAGSSTTG